jgi:A/G-specific adenine glycosylase
MSARSSNRSSASKRTPVSGRANKASDALPNKRVSNVKDKVADKPAVKLADGELSDLCRADRNRFSTSVLRWFDQFGRKTLPWQLDTTPYRVWISEIMLQQTQVTTVIPYYQRFMQSFPTVSALAQASQDDVLDHWTGLGYYARGRNLHKAAQIIHQEFSGTLPGTVDALEQLPGIGRSTAGAIVSLGHGQWAPILDGNVKRVLCRHYTVDGWYGQSAVQKQLWHLSEQLTPTLRTGNFNQAMMDIGATVCTRSSPNCSECPVNQSCAALAIGRPVDWPHRKPVKEKPKRRCWMLVTYDATGRILLEKRPQSGIWGGLWSLPQFDSVDELRAAATALGGDGAALEKLGQIEHTFTHFHLTINPLIAHVGAIESDEVMDTADRVWYKQGDAPGGFAAPVAKLLDSLTQSLV